jgi:hypothetical protein
MVLIEYSDNTSWVRFFVRGDGNFAHVFGDSDLDGYNCLFRKTTEGWKLEVDHRIVATTSKTVNYGGVELPSYAALDWVGLSPIIKWEYFLKDLPGVYDRIKAEFITASSIKDLFKQIFTPFMKITKPRITVNDVYQDVYNSFPYHIWTPQSLEKELSCYGTIHPNIPMTVFEELISFLSIKHEKIQLSLDCD